MRLKVCWYGTRDAMQAFEFNARDILLELGFGQGQYTPCVYWNEGRCLDHFVHGDDFPPLSSDGLPENSMLSATVAAAESVPLEEAQDEGASHGRGEPTAQDVEAEV